MSTVAGIRLAPNVVHPTTFAPPAGVAVSTLPPPPNQTDGTQDALSELYALMCKLTDSELTRDQNKVKIDQNERQDQQARRNADLARAQREAQKGGFMKWITKDIGIVGFAGLCTFNYGLVAGDIAAHKSGLVKNLKIDVADGAAAFMFQEQPELLIADILVRKLNVAPDELKKEINDRLGPFLDEGVGDKDVQPFVAKAVQVNLLIAGAAASVLSAGTASGLVVALIAVALSAGAFASQEAGGPPWLTIGLEVAGAALSAGAGYEGGTSSMLMGGTSTKIAANAAAKGVGAINGAMSGTDTIVNTIHQNVEDNANQNAQAALNAMTKMQRLIDDLIDALKATQDSKKRMASVIQGALETYNQTNVSITAAVKA